MQSALDIQSTFLDISPSTTAGHFPHSVLELRHAEAITSTSQPEAHLPAAPVKQFPEDQATCQVAEGPTTMSPTIPA
jgi:hypothetical protein